MKSAPTPLFILPPVDPDRDYAPGFRVVEEISEQVNPRQFAETEIAAGMLESGVHKKERLRRVRQTFMAQHPWVPYSEAELTLGNVGLDRKINGTIGKVGDRTLPAIEKHAENADSFHSQALVDFVNLNQALKTDESHDPSINQLRANSDVKQVLVKYLYAKFNLERLEWPHRKPKSRVYKTNLREQELMEIEMGLNQLDDDALINLWREARKSTGERLEYWDGQLQEVKDSSNYDIRAAIGQ